MFLLFPCTAADWLKTVRAFGALAIVLLLFAIVSGLLKIRLKDRPVVLIITVVLAFMSGNVIDDWID